MWRTKDCEPMSTARISCYNVSFLRKKKKGKSTVSLGQHSGYGKAAVLLTLPEAFIVCCCSSRSCIVI